METITTYKKFDKITEQSKMVLKIIDFGWARKEFTQTDEHGCLRYKAPECVLPGRSKGLKSDLYSLGAIILDAFQPFKTNREENSECYKKTDEEIQVKIDELFSTDLPHDKMLNKCLKMIMIDNEEQRASVTDIMKELDLAQYM